VGSVSADFTTCIPSYLVYYRWEDITIEPLFIPDSPPFWYLSALLGFQSKLLAEWVLRAHWFVLMKEILDPLLSPVEENVEPQPVPSNAINLPDRSSKQTNTYVCA